MDYFLIIIRTFLSYSVLVLSLRIMGKREIGQLSLFDLIILLSIADIIIIGVQNFHDNYLYVLIPVIILTLLQKIVAFIMLKSSKVRRIMDGSPSIIILNGIIQKDEMKKQAYNIDDLLLQLRTQGIFNVEEVNFAILETNGKLSILKKQDSNDFFPLPVIISGKIDYKILEITGKNEIWLTQQIGKNHLVKEEILCAFVSSTGFVWF